MHLKITLRVRAGRADLRRFLPHHNMPAVAALPDFHLALGKNRGRLHILKQGPVALLVVFLDRRYQAEFLRQLLKALFLRCLRKALDRKSVV